MSDTTPAAPEAPAPGKSQQQTVTFFFEKTASFQTVHVDGAVGGVTPTGQVFLAFYAERAPIPKTVICPVSEEGIGEPTSVTGKQGIFRELQVGIIMTPTTLKALRDQLDKLTKNFPDASDAS